MRTLVTSLLLLMGVAFAQGESLPDNPAFDQPVSIVASTNLDLEMALGLLGDTIGYQVISKNLPEQTLNYDLSAPRPFREAWTLIVKLYDLEFVAQDDLLLVAPPGELAAFQTAEEVAQEPVDVTYEPEHINEVNGLLMSRFGERVQTMPAEPAGVLIVTATPAVHEDVRAFITEFDARITAVEEEKKVKTVNDLIEVEAGAEQIASQLTSTYPEVQASVLAEIGAISITTTPELWDEVEAYVRELEQMQIEARPTRVAYRINNAKAGDISGAISTALEAQGSTATVASDERTNTLIIVGDASAHEIAQGMITDLDTRERQVKIRVRIQEISQTEMDSLGVDLSAGVGTLSADLLATGLQLAFNPSEVINALTLNATLDTLQEQSLSRTIDDAQILAMNNKATTINSGGSIEIAVQGQEGLETQTLQFGTNVTVTPQVTDDGFVTLELDIGLSGFDGELSNLTGLQFSEKRVNTTVQIEDGDVLVLGGLIKESISVSESGAPILKDLPVIGTFFRTSSNRMEESELVIVLEAQIE